MKTLAVMAVLCTLIGGAAAQSSSSYHNPYNPINQAAGELQLQNSNAMQNAEVLANAARAQAMIDQLNQQRMMQQQQMQQQLTQQQMQQQSWVPWYSTPAVPQITTVPIYTPAPTAYWPY